MTKDKEVTLINTNGTKLISLSEEEAQKVMVDLNIALDRHRMNNNNNNLLSDKLIEREREIIQRAKFLKQNGITYKHI